MPTPKKKRVRIEADSVIVFAPSDEDLIDQFPCEPSNILEIKEIGRSTYKITYSITKKK